MDEDRQEMTRDGVIRMAVAAGFKVFGAWILVVMMPCLSAPYGAVCTMRSGPWSGLPASPISTPQNQTRARHSGIPSSMHI